MRGGALVARLSLRATTSTANGKRCSKTEKITSVLDRRPLKGPLPEKLTSPRSSTTGIVQERLPGREPALQRYWMIGSVLARSRLKIDASPREIISPIDGRYPRRKHPGLKGNFEAPGHKLRSVKVRSQSSSHP